MKYFIALACCILLFANACESPSKQHSSTSADEAYIERGQEIAMKTFATLSSNLQKEMQSGGLSSAVNYCNHAASPLVGRLQRANHASIKRTSLKLRNTKNAPSPEEKKQLLAYQALSDAGKTLDPVILKRNDRVTFYSPCLLYTSPSPRDATLSRMPSSA